MEACFANPVPRAYEAHEEPATMPNDPVIARLMKLAARAGLAEVEESIWYRTPSLKVAGKSMTRIKDDDTLVFHCSLEDKNMLMAPKRLTQASR
jgi:hypothetical protein